MNSCKEFQQALPDLMEGTAVSSQNTVPGAALKSHLESCPACSSLLQDLQAIVREAGTLAASEEPNARVWIGIHNSLEAEGLIRKQAPRRSRLTDLFAIPRWRPVLMPLATAAALAVAFFGYRATQNTSMNVAQNPAVISRVGPAIAAFDDEDVELLNEITSKAPAQRAAYEDNLKDVNAYILDAKASVDSDPSDQEARQQLMQAYDQKAMLYNMAMERSLK